MVLSTAIIKKKKQQKIRLSLYTSHTIVNNYDSMAPFNQVSLSLAQQQVVATVLFWSACLGGGGGGGGF